MGHVRKFRHKRPRAHSLRRHSGIRFNTSFVVAVIAAAAVGYFGFDPSPAGPSSPSVTSPSSALIGRASVIDGDTIEIQGERVRLNGIDAPESAQLCNDASGKSYRCGAVAAQALSAFLAKSSPTKCEYVERDQYGRFVGNCLRADGSSVAAWLVRNGHALDWRRYSNGAYAADQKTAAAAKVGLWAGTFQSPWEWRAEQSSIVEVPAPAMPIAPLTAMRKTGKCEIKGNISNKGERIYHTPGQKFYSRTRISESKGEHWFCSEAEARAAGWRRALR